MTRLKIATLVLVGVGTVALSACGSSASGGPAGTQAPAATTAPTSRAGGGGGY